MIIMDLVLVQELQKDWNCSLPKKAKARATLLVVMKAKKKGFSKIHILSITIEVINAINGNTNWSINSIAADILVTSKNFINVESSYIPRKHNSLVHHLGNLSFTRGANFEWFGWRVFLFGGFFVGCFLFLMIFLFYQKRKKLNLLSCDMHQNEQ